MHKQDSAEDKDGHGPEDEHIERKQSGGVLTKTLTLGEAPETPLKVSISRLLDSTGFIIGVSIITLWALFGDDIRVVSSPPDLDSVYNISFIVCFGVFVLEIILSCYSKPDYLWTFFFYLDVASAVTVLFDVGWVGDIIFESSTGTTGTSQIAKAAKASKIGARATRIIRILRLIRLIRIVKLYKATTAKNKQSKLKGSTKDADYEKFKFNAKDYDKNSGNQNEGLQAPSGGLSRDLRNDSGNSSQIHQFQGGGSGLYNSGVRNHQGIMKSHQASKHGLGIESQHNPDFRSDRDPQPSALNKNKGSSDDVSEFSSPSTPVIRNQARRHGGRSLILLNANPSNVLDAETIQQDLLQYEEEINKRDAKALAEISSETNLGKQVTFSITKILISLILVILITDPLFSTDTYVSGYTPQNASFGMLVAMMNQPESEFYKAAWQSVIEQYRTTNIKLIQLQMFLGYNESNPVLMPAFNYEAIPGGPNNYRDAELTTFSGFSDDYSLYGWFETTRHSVLGGYLSIIRTVLVCLVLGASMYILSRDSEELIVQPISNMIITVNRISENPLEAAALEENRLGNQDVAEADSKTTRRKKKQVEEKQENYEPSVLQQIIVKIGALLAIGFGEAGSDIIAQNMALSGSVDPMIQGRKVFAVFGFCDIRNFTDATEVLKKEVMEFVNEIAHIVHSEVDAHFGASNKNIGDAFLMVWKIPDSEIDIAEDGQFITKNGFRTKLVCDLSILSFIKIIARIGRSKVLSRYGDNKLLNDRLKIQRYRVAMGFGLHLGWAIEGAIGSKFKIDASYLSPNVNMAARLEAATKQFGVQLLISGSIHACCSGFFQSIMRRIDRVTVKGSKQPIDLFTVDLESDKLEIDYREVDFTKQTPIEKRRDKVEARANKEDLMIGLLKRINTTQKMFQSDSNIKYMRLNYNKNFYINWETGMAAYLAGNWPKAKSSFEETLEWIPNKLDGPSKTLLGVIDSHQGVAPAGWQGFRELTEK